MITNNELINHPNHECPICGGQIELDDSTIIHELLECIDCGTELEVIGLNPVILSEAPIASEDWGQ